MTLKQSKKQNIYFKKESIKKFVNIWMTIMFVICAIGFILTSFNDIDLLISDWLDPLMYIEFFRAWQALMEVLGTHFAIWILFICLAIWVESYYIRLKHGVFGNNKFNKYMKHNAQYYLGGVYALYIIIRGILYVWWLTTIWNLDMGWGKGYDAKSMMSMCWRFSFHCLALLIEIALVSLTIYWFRKSFRNKKLLLTSNHWFQALKVFMFFFYCYVMIWFAKHFLVGHFTFLLSMTECMHKCLKWVDMNQQILVHDNDQN
ncbi:hypothetical protein SCLARK_001739 [Spiroplasma clarkii]|nr:hypothetical protein SCLARK_001739 [Spiroplasma clarkii]